MARVLLVDDDEDFRDLTAIGLARAGHIFLGVADGLQALAYLLGRPPDVVLLDLNMPGLTSDDFLTACRHTPRWAGVPIALVSGREDVAAVAGRLGAAHLQKPVRLAEVRRLVDALTAGRPGMAARAG